MAIPYDGGRAFAQVEMLPDPEFPGHREPQLSGGISIRDWFAGRALQGMLANPAMVFWTDERLVEKAGILADAMLAERERAR